MVACGNLFHVIITCILTEKFSSLLSYLVRNPVHLSNHAITNTVGSGTRDSADGVLAASCARPVRDKQALQSHRSHSALQTCYHTREYFASFKIYLIDFGRPRGGQKRSNFFS